MVFARPSALWLLIPVAAVALVTWLRPGRRLLPVAAVCLWREAAAELDDAQRPKRPISLSWILLLLGAIAAVAAIAHPVGRTHRPRRSVAVQVVASAEGADPAALQALRDAVTQFARQLDGRDRVQLLLPVRAGGATELMSPAEAIEATGRMAPVMAKAADLHFPAAHSLVQQTYRIAPAGALPLGARDILTAATIPPLTLDAVAAAQLDDGSAQLMVAVRNHAAVATTATLQVDFGAVDPAAARRVDVPANERVVEIVQVPAGVARINVSIGSRVGQYARLAARRAGDVEVAVIGRDNAFISRFIRAMPGVAPAASLADADVVIASGVDPSDNRPGILFDAPTPPVGWRRSEPIGPVALADANVLADSPLLADVDLSAVAVRQSRPLVSDPSARGQRLVTLDAGALILATSAPRRLHVAFDPDAANTGWGLDESFPILMAAAVTWMTADAAGDWVVTDGVVGLLAADAPPSDLPAITLPGPALAAGAVDLWPAFAVVAGLLWLASWWRR